MKGSRVGAPFTSKHTQQRRYYKGDGVTRKITAQLTFAVRDEAHSEHLRPASADIRIPQRDSSELLVWIQLENPEYRARVSGQG